jgi:peptidoglycan hydrolase-like protein with peptidoglycan-binding domain
VTLTLSTPLRQNDEPLSNEADTTGTEAKPRLQAMLAEILARSQALALDDRQIAGVSRMYWRQPSATADEAISELIGLLSAQQFRAAIGRYARGSAEPALAEPDLSDKLDRLVNAAIDRVTKDKTVIEIELAAKVADRLIGWAKTFAYFVAVPVAILFIILAVFGVSKFEDVQQAASQANKMLADATANLDKGQTNLAAAEQKLADLTKNVAEIEQTTIQNSDKLAKLKHYLPENYINDFLGPRNKTVSDVKNKLKEMGLYHGEIDDKVDDKTIAAITSFQQKRNLPADGLLGIGTYQSLFGSDQELSSSNTSHPAVSAPPMVPPPTEPPAQTAPSLETEPDTRAAPGTRDAPTNR